MLTSQKVIDAINEQIGYEFSASLQYYAIAAHFAAEALPQLSQHFFRQAEEEKGHALRFIKYVVDAGGRVVIPAIDAPESKFKSTARCRETVTRSGDSRDQPDQRLGRTRAKEERLYHDQFFAVVFDGTARGSLVDGSSAQDHRARGR